MLSQDHFELIEAYLNQQLSPTDRQSFEQELTADESLRRHVATYRTLRKGLNGLAIEERVQQANQRYKARPDIVPVLPETQVRPLMPTRTQPVWVRWAAAASVLLTLSIAIYWYQRTQQPTFLSLADSSLYQPNDQLTKSLPASLTPHDRQQLLTAIQHYNAGKYDAVIDQLRIPAKGRTSEPYRRYFLGLSYLANKQPAEAIRPLQEAVGTATGTLQQKADWFLALAYLKTEQPTLAQPILDRVRTDASHPYQGIATELAERMKQR
jgi:hypothetical protein